MLEAVKSKTESDPSGIGEVYTPFGGSIFISVPGKGNDFDGVQQECYANL